MKMKEDVFLDGEKIDLLQFFDGEEIDDDLRLLDEDLPTKDLSEFIENTKELDWSKDE